MKKTGFRTFVCSFVFSLFIIFVINGLFFYSPKESSQELIIPEKNIALFFSGAQNPPLSAQIKPIKKIALSLSPAQISKSAAVSRENSNILKTAERNIIPLEIADNSHSSDNQAQALADMGPKSAPLNGVKSITDPDNNSDQGGWDTGNDDYTVEQNSRKNKPLTIAELDAKAPPQKAISSITDSDNDTGGDYDTGNDDYSQELVAPDAPPLLTANNEAKSPPLNGVKSITDPDNNSDQGGWDTGNDDYGLKKKPNEPKPLLIAQNDIKAPPQKAISSITDSDNDTGGDYDTGNDDYSGEQNLLIPLQKDFSDNGQNNTFKIAKTADKNQIAMVSGNTPLGSMVKEKEDIAEGIVRRDPEPEENQPSADKDWKSMAEQQGEGNPWVAAKGTKFPKNNSVLGADYYKNADDAKLQVDLATGSNNNGKPVQLASDMVQNILIPIPEDILNDDNLTPQLESSNKDRKLEEEVTRREQEKSRENSAALQMKQEIARDDSTSLPEQTKNESKSGGLLKSITSIFSGSSSSSSPKEVGVESSGNSFMDRIAGRVGKPKQGSAPAKILPAEMRLAFQPNRAEISGVTLKWIQAFATKVNSDRSVILEIRIDGTSSYALQQKRLNLLHNILTNKGVDYSKINTVFTTREPNSFILRTVRINSNIDRDVKESREQAAYYQSW